MRGFTIKVLTFIVAFSTGISAYFVFVNNTQNEILQLTQGFEEAYKNQDEQLVNLILADDFTYSSSTFKEGFNKSYFLERLWWFKKYKVDIIYIEIQPIWIQADRNAPRVTFDSKGTFRFEDGKVITFYGQYTLTFEKRERGWQIVSMNFDENYQDREPSWAEKKILRIARSIEYIFHLSDN